MNIVYVRVSKESLSFDNQISKIKDYLNNINLPINKLVKDISFGFEEKENNVLYNLVIKSNSNDSIILYNISRISRYCLHVKNFLNIAKQKGLKVIIVDKNIQSQMIKENPKELDLILSNITELDKQYVSIITKNALIELKEKGIKLGRPNIINSERYDEVYKLYDSGLTMEDVGKKVGMSRATVSRILAKRRNNVEIMPKILEYRQKSYTIQQIADIMGISIDKISEMLNIKDTTKEHISIKLTTEEKFTIWGDWKMGKKIVDIAKEFSITPKDVDYIIQSLKGGAHW